MRMKALRHCPAAPSRWASAWPAVSGIPAFQRPRHPGVQRMVGRFEGQHHDRHRAIGSAGVERLLGIEDSAIGWI
jgi:hypothetical protein